jgi:hypothetical protein
MTQNARGSSTVASEAHATETRPGSVSAGRRFPADLSRRQFALALLVILAVAIGLRTLFPVADPPWRPGVGVVWHDEGTWVHNARNRALFGAWKLDEWNPMYVTPVLTGLEYVSFSVAGVGLLQARLVPALLGTLSVLLLGLGVARAANRLAGAIAAMLLATSFVYVMYDRAATIEGTMIAFLVVSWYGYARAGNAPRWGLLAGAAAVVAYFTKASAVFFVGALGLDALLSLFVSMSRSASPASASLRRRAALYTLSGLAVAALVALVVFVLPNWTEYRFYNWQVSVTRKPAYSVRAVLDRASWLPIDSDFFTRMWPVLVIAAGAALGRLANWRSLVPAERLLLWWIGLGISELVLHDVQERRLVFLIPPMVALAGVVLGRDRRLVPTSLAASSPARTLAAAPIVFYALYMVAGALARLPFIYSVGPGVRAASGAAALLGLAFYATRRRVIAWLARQQWSVAAALVLALLLAAGDLAQFTQWAVGRTYKNYEAMRLVATWLPPGTVVHGKLANGLALESTIRPIFVGRGFGNYEDRRRRDDARYLLTYVSPSLGYESQAANSVVRDILDAYPRWRIVRTFPVRESPGGTDAAALIDKMPDR